VSPSRYHVEADSVDELNARILDQYGADAAVVATTVVTTGGVQGFFARRKFQATVEVADGTPNDAHAFDLPARAGIAALLDSADYGDAVDKLPVTSRTPAVRQPVPVGDLPATRRAPAVDQPGPVGDLPATRTAPTPDAPAGVRAAATVDELPREHWAPSTATLDFAAILADLTLNTVAAIPAIRPPVPAGPMPLRGAGDLVVVIGLGDDSFAVATAIANGAGASILRIAGTVDRPGVGRVDDRREAIASRAEGVRRERAVVVAFGLPRGGPTSESAIQLENLHADQFWVAVDAGRKPDDTARWVAAVSAIVPVAAVMSWAPDETASPHSVSQLGLPVGWLESGW
jgi:hypothetical protein